MATWYENMNTYVQGYVHAYNSIVYINKDSHICQEYTYTLRIVVALENAHMACIHTYIHTYIHIGRISSKRLHGMHTYLYANTHHTHTHTHTPRITHTHTQKHTHTHPEAHTHTHPETHTHTHPEAHIRGPVKITCND